MSMKADQENFDQLRRLLALKKYEQPPAGYFSDFSQQVIMHIRAAGPEAEAAGAERLVWEAPWLQRFWATLEHNPILAGAFGVMVCALLISGVIYSENMARLPEVGAIDTGVEQLDAHPTTVAGGSTVTHPLLAQPASTDFPSTFGASPTETRGSLFDEFRSGQSPERAKPVMFNVPEGAIKP